MSTRNVRQALYQPGYLRSAWPWRAVLYLMSSAPVGLLALLGIIVLALVGGVLTILVLGLVVLAALGLAGVPVGAIERRRLRLVDDRPARSPHRPPDEPGLLAWARVRYQERATWYELAYAVLFAFGLWMADAMALLGALGAPLSMMATPILLALDGGGQAQVLKYWSVTSYNEAAAWSLAGAMLLPVALYCLGTFAGLRAAFARLLLAGPDDPLREELGEVARSRARLVHAFEAERRRIERDLHDGAQQRLVALTMTLGLARLDAPPGPLADQLAKAHDEAGKVLAELRELIHGIHPQVLADRGLEAALEDAADRSPIPVLVHAPGLGRLPEPVEKAAYFVVCEALANVAKHSAAALAEVGAEVREGALFVSVVDDGVGGAVLRRGGSGGGAGVDAGGSGLTGLSDRVAALDGTLTLSSPPGGPTILGVEIPCEPIEASLIN
ncbi:sensor histidine kinase [Streptomyces lonegramiae]|uniref:histidine kinase n=1 Tax=Streptomyces lonegramiae TaxID=3075524 RepID=A0ABU2XL51_9ACTN|nr:sensor domain-containing protein [Streptomyces sp. DSM 41529]MDT0546652.1 sensor domain-containing protein [Streptomyces sp. DSM 41529]